MAEFSKAFLNKPEAKIFYNIFLIAEINDKFIHIIIRIKKDPGELIFHKNNFFFFYVMILFVFQLHEENGQKSKFNESESEENYSAYLQ